MKNKVVIVISAILIGIALSYLYSNMVFFHHHDEFKRFQEKLYVKDNRAKQDFELLKNDFLLKIKSSAGKTEHKKIFVNGLRVTPNIFPYTRGGKSSEISYIHLPKKIITEGKNSIEIVFSNDHPPNVVVTLSNYRKKISDDIYVVFSDSFISAFGNISFKPMLAAIILTFLLFGTMTYLLSKIFLLRINKLFLYQVYSLLPFLVFLFSLLSGNNLIGGYQVVITPSYFWTLGLVSFFITEGCLVLRKLIQDYNKFKFKGLKSKEISFLKPQVLEFTVKVISWLKTRKFADKCFLLFMILLSTCVFLLILHLEPAAEQLANIAYFALVTGVIIKFIKFIKEGRKLEERE